MIEKSRPIHFIGIGGSGLSAMARVLHERGFKVSGSDRAWSPLVEELSREGIAVSIGHHPQNVSGAQLVIRSSAIPDENTEVQAARAQGIPVLKRVEFLPYLVGDQGVIAIAGTHGKTTTTAMVAWVLSRLGLEPSYVIGGICLNLQRNAHAGKGSYFVIEADEYDQMFLGLNPTYAIITNIEHDHPDCYPTPHHFEAAFAKFASQIRSEGFLLACVEDEGVRRLFAKLGPTPSRYGYALKTDSAPKEAAYFADGVTKNSYGAYSFRVEWQKQPIANIELRVPGIHNVYNATAVLALCHQLNLPLDEVACALREFKGVARRFQTRGVIRDITVIDDYAHHPSEIRATLAAARDRFPGQFIWAVWQPHTYSRTLTFWQDFRSAFSNANAVVVLDVYGARESAPSGFSMAKLVTEIQAEQRFFIPQIDSAVQFFLESLAPKHVVVVLSAGDADQLSTRLLRELDLSLEEAR